MSMAMVSRRFAGYAKKGKGKPRPRVVRQPTVKDKDDLVGDEARPQRAMAAFVPRQLPPTAWWQKAWKPAAISVGLLACCWFAFVVVNSSNQSSSNYAADSRSYSSASPSSMGISSRRGGQAAAYPGNTGATESIVLSDRSTPTDESFRATAYVRKKVSLPNKVSLSHMSGECVVKGGGVEDIVECLRK